MKAHIFLFANLKFQLQILCSFGDITKNVKLNGIPKNNFLCIFIIVSSPGVHTFFCLWRVNKKLPQGETSQNAFRGQGQLIKSEKMHVKMGTSTFNRLVNSHTDTRCIKVFPNGQPKIGIKFLVGQVVLELLIKTAFCTF